MEELIKQLKKDCTLLISETSAEFRNVLNLDFINSKNCHSANLAIFVLLLKEDCEFNITVSDEYTVADHRFWGVQSIYPCKTVFVHTTYKDFDENMKKLNAMLEL